MTASDWWMPVFTEVADEIDEELGEDGEGDNAELIPAAAIPLPPPPPLPFRTVPLVAFCLPLGLTVALQVVLRAFASFSVLKIPRCWFERSEDALLVVPLEEVFADAIPFVDANLADVIIPFDAGIGDEVLAVGDFSLKLDDRGFNGGGIDVSPALWVEEATLD